MKKICGSCRAFESWKRFGRACELGFKIKYFYKDEFHRENLLESYKPLEECPKPLTMTDYIREKETRRV